MQGEGIEFQVERPVQMSRGSMKFTASVNLKIVRQRVHMLCTAALLLALHEDFKGSQVIIFSP